MIMQMYRHMMMNHGWHNKIWRGLIKSNNLSLGGYPAVRYYDEGAKRGLKFLVVNGFVRGYCLYTPTCINVIQYFTFYRTFCYMCAVCLYYIVQWASTNLSYTGPLEKITIIWYLFVLFLCIMLLLCNNIIILYRTFHAAVTVVRYKPHIVSLINNYKYYSK